MPMPSPDNAYATIGSTTPPTGTAITSVRQEHQRRAGQDLIAGRAPKRAAVIEPVVQPSVVSTSATATTPTGSPKPTWSCSGRYTSAPRNAEPAASAATLAASETGRCVNTGTDVRRSCTRNATAGTSAAHRKQRIARGQQQQQHGCAQQRRADHVQRLAGARAARRSGCDRSASLPAQATIAIIGRLTQNTHRQPTEPVSAAPSAGPISADTPHMAAFSPNARGRSYCGTDSANRASGTANMKPAPRPSTPRDTATIGIDGASPPTTLAAANSTHAIAKLRATP